ncbi:hypothetical protein QE418_001341 [Microbacterium testaceum]|uniref:DUF3320 domain-containing protein n=2 Tax=Microbacterium TaxID=33882 RepID=UPI0027824E54|nr:DUF3320 domain-containing protein [Microbacterium testaceum]MDQ1111893.1 hypothetical protein [Microbacterium testaceum]MDR6097570.1 hypothetical protein [Microbacterium sp. SORGH_AS_0454]
MTIDTRQLIGGSVDDLAEGLRPFIERVFVERLPQGPSWVQIIAHKDELAGRSTSHHHANDVGLMLRVMTEKLGNLGYPFDGHISRQAANWASEMREVRNRHAHQVDFSLAETYRALDSAELLLREVGAADEAQRIAARKPAVLSALGGGITGRSLPAPPSAPQFAPSASRLPAPPAVAPPSSTEPAATTAPSAESDATAIPTLTRRQLREQPETDASATPSGPTPSARLSLDAVTELSYAMAHARIVPVQEVRVSYDGPELRGASLEIEASTASGSLGAPKVVILDLAPGLKTLAGIDLLSLDPAPMLQVDTEQPGFITLTLRGPDGAVIADHRHPVTVLAANQWIARELHLGLELLASFVQPQATTLTLVLQRASDLLGQSSGRTQLDGYQSDNPARVDAMVAAIWDAVRELDIRYAEPPASWGLRGQKVRTPQEVLEGRLGTCLDTTLTLAALLEQVGINSTLWLVDGHIFLGYWREDRSLGLPATTDIEEAANLAKLGRISLLETTRMTGGAASATFDVARSAPEPYLEARRDEILGVTDVRAARENGILPLPSRKVGIDGEVTVVEYRPLDRVLQTFVAGQRDAQGRTVAPPRVAQWKNALLDLSLRNRLINFTSSAGYQLAVPGAALGRLEDMINAGASVTLLASDDVPEIARERGIRFGRDRDSTEREALLADKRQAHLSDVTQAAYTTRLRALAAKAKTVTEETGANNLYLAFGTLRWEFNDRQLQSPLVLVPVNLESVSRGQSFRLVLDEAGASTPNYCLLEKLKVSFGIEVPGLANPATDAAGIDLGAAFDAVRQAMVDAKRPFIVEDTVHLGILQFAKFRLWKDLDDNWEELSTNSLVTHLIHSPNEAFIDAVPAPVDVDLDALSAQVPVSADSSQLEAVVEAVEGRTFVLEGPPGTGKSQTITNLLVRSLASGKRVLFVAEKRAALEVVKDRLDAVGLGSFSLDLHDKGARPNAVREQLRAALDATARPDRAALSAQREAAESSRGALSRYAQRVHEPNAAGLSLYSARSQLLASAADIPPLDVPASLVASGDHIDQLRATLRQLPAVSDLARPAATHPWGFVDDPAVDAVTLHSAARSFDEALERVGASELLSRVREPQQLDAWAGVARAPRHALDVLDRVQPESVDDLVRRLATSVAQPPAWLAQVDPRVLSRNLRDIHAAALAADTSSFFGRKKRRRAVLAQFAADLRGEPTAIDLRGLSTLTGAMAETAAQVEELRGELQRLPVVVAAADFNPYVAGAADQVGAALTWVGWLSRTLSSGVSGAGDLRTDLRRVYETTTPDTAAAERFAALAAAWRALTAAAGGGASDHLAIWAGDEGIASTWERTRTARNLVTTEPVTLGRWIDLLRHVEPLRLHGMHAAREAILAGRIRADDAALAFDKGVAAASLAEREDATALSDFDPAAHNRTIARFATSSAAIRGELPRALPADILSQRRFDPKFDGGDMGALKRQLSRQRGGDSVRTLMDKYGDLITQITPCMLMSPESVARFFPARAGMFDVVVFDEASQIRVADAVGAMGRARSVVVVGDSKQMPPSTFAEVTADGDEAEADAGVVADEESILTECTQARVPSKWLSWHYRSQDEALIAFSNHQYYESRLSSFPAPLRDFSASVPDALATSKPDYGLSLVRVDGRFERSGGRGVLRTNRVEAQTIVDEVIRRFAAAGDTAPSIGIITFNVQQRDLIDNMLRDAPDERIGRALDERDGLFVKNLESVQGDERDTILFSVAFSKNDRGMLPLNFGPLSRAGGERRLNVAVTRARRQVVLYASFDPAELRAEQTSARGLKDLKSYLELAARGVAPTDDSTARVPMTDRHRDEIAAVLRERGLVVKTDVGLSDFRIDLTLASASDPAQPLIAVLLDGEGWRARRTVADRDGLPVDVLGGLMRWPGIERVWLPEWLDNPDATADRLVAAVHCAEAGGLSASALTAESVAPQVEDLESLGAEEPSEPLRGRMPEGQEDEGDVGVTHPHVRPFVPWPITTSGGVAVLDALPSPSAAQRVRSVLVEVIAAEGPISRARLVRLAAESFGLSRVSGTRATAILGLVPDAHTRRGDEHFVWPEGVVVDTWRQVRTSTPGDSRPLESVALEEIANAMAVVAELGGGVREEEIKREALRLFGGKRMTTQISERLTEALTVAVATRRVELAPSGAYVARS